MRRRLLALAALVCLLVLAPAATAATLPALQAKLGREMGLAGTFSGAYVRDLDTGQALFARRPDVARVPASVQKLYTTSTSLLRLGPDATLPTVALTAAPLDAGGVLRGDLVVRGGGDPTLDRARIAQLASSLQAGGIARIAGSVLGDESRFDLLRGSYDTGGSYDRDMGGVLGALTVGRGFSTDLEPGLGAAKALVRVLRADGVRVDGATSTGAAPDGARPMAQVLSPAIRDLIALTNVPSDNYYAETLLKDLGASFGGAGTTAAGAAVVRAQLASFGVHPRVVDGSGLSRADRTTPRQVVRLLERMHGQEVGTDFEASLPVAGRTGTLRRRMRGTPAQDDCHAKTGTLIGVSTLAGVCFTASGHTLAFALMMNRANVGRAHGVQDRMTAAIAAYSG
ncbi:MAG: D-alanyl-D-alanine carboxypeptidase/D-alanyl-D-alanine-endopeptidase [Actinomycetota bacterium]|nr:D-alanyl-D-alanine carboxypeptidase/D-alanyl-D-alanine-endopeptidase [Actinomycetota bacterium]